MDGWCTSGCWFTVAIFANLSRDVVLLIIFLVHGPFANLMVLVLFECDFVHVCHLWLCKVKQL